MTTSPLRVTIVINDLFRGGAQRIVADLVARSDRARYSYEIIYFNRPAPGSPDDTFEAEMQEAGAMTYFAGGNGGIRNLWTLMQRIRTTHPQVLFTLLPYSCILGRLAGMITRIPVMSAQCNLPFTYPLHIRFLDWITLPFVRAWVGTTSGIEAAYGKNSALFNESLWQNGRRHFTLYGGVDVLHIREAVHETNRVVVRRELGIPEHASVVMMVARLISWKGHRDLIDAMAFLPDTHALVVGWGPLEQELRGYAREQDVGERIHFLGRRTDVYTLLGVTDCYVQAHQKESNGQVWMGPNLSQIEACAAGVPSVSTAVPFIEELIEDGVTGRIAALNNPKDLARAIASAFKEREISRVFARRAQERVRSHYSVETMVRTYEYLFAKIAT